MRSRRLLALVRPARRLRLIIFVLLVLPAPSVNALSPAQKQLYDQGIHFVDLNGATSSCSSINVPPGDLPSMIPEPYNGAFTSAGKAYNVSPLLLAALFTEENFTNTPTNGVAARWKQFPSVHPDPNKGWPVSPDDAMGPFQFIPSTWANLGVDANKDGQTDVNNLLDASYGAANYAKTDGATADKPKSVWVNFADGYSGHTGGYADMVSQYIDLYASGGTGSGGGSGGTPSSDGSCGPGAVSGSIVDTAVNFAWDDYPGGHNFSSKEPKPAYKQAVSKYESELGNSPDYTDCGVFVATVMRASGVDADYPASGTGAQLSYVLANKAKYETIGTPGQWTTKDLQPGDILLADVNGEGHTYIYVGRQSDGYSVAEASQEDHVPEIDHDPYPSQTINGVTENFYIIRVKQ